MIGAVAGTAAGLALLGAAAYLLLKATRYSRHSPEHNDHDSISTWGNSESEAAPWGDYYNAGRSVGGVINTVQMSPRPSLGTIQEHEAGGKH